LEAGVSSRLLSFIETGRSSPSREMVLALADALEIPLRDRNALLEAAGYAGLYRETSLDDRAMDQVRDALELLLRASEPNPTLVVNRRFDVLMANAAAQRLVSTFCERLEAFAPPMNLARLLVSPQGFRPFVANWEEIAGNVLGRVEEELARSRRRDALDEALLEELLPVLRALRRQRRAGEPGAVLLPVKLRRDEIALDLFTTITTLGTPLDITLQELRIETLFPADASSKAALAQWLGSER
jgi:transcriptional regulator with XRE-family HTH domain